MVDAQLHQAVACRLDVVPDHQSVLQFAGTVHDLMAVVTGVLAIEATCVNGGHSTAYLGIEMKKVSVAILPDTALWHIMIFRITVILKVLVALQTSGLEARIVVEVNLIKVDMEAAARPGIEVVRFGSVVAALQQVAVVLLSVVEAIATLPAAEGA